MKCYRRAWSNAEFDIDPRYRNRYAGVLFALVLLLTAFAAPADAQLAFSTYLGGSGGDTIRDVAVDGAGNIYLTGGTQSPTFPTTAGAYDRTHNGNMDVFAAKLSPTGQLIWSTFIGGPNYDRAYAIEVDAKGFVYIAGRAGAGFPTTPGALQTSFGGDTSPNTPYGQQDGFVTKLSPDGSSIVWSTYVGGAGRDFIRDIDIDTLGNVYLGVSDVNFPHPHVKPGAFQPTRKGTYDGFLGKLSANGSTMLWGSYFGGSGSMGDGWTPSVRVDKAGNLFYLTFTQDNDVPITAGVYQPTRRGGWDMVLAKISPTGQLLASTFFGGTLNEYTETHGLAIDSQGNPIIAASTSSNDLPTTVGAYDRTYNGTGGSGTGGGTNYYGDGFVAKLSANLSTLLAATYVGGNFGDGIEGVDVDVSDNILVSGATYSTSGFPISVNGVQKTKTADADFFAVKLSSDLSQLLYGTYLGGNSTDYGRTSALTPAGEIIVAGDVLSTNFPTAVAIDSSYGGGADAGVAKIIIGVGGSSPPSPPTNLTITQSTLSLSNLFTWEDTAFNESGFIVKRNGVEIARPPANVEQYTDVIVDPVFGKLYCYQVAAFHGGGTSVFTPNACVASQ